MLMQGFAMLGHSVALRFGPTQDVVGSLMSFEESQQDDLVVTLPQELLLQSHADLQRPPPVPVSRCAISCTVPLPMPG